MWHRGRNNTSAILGSQPVSASAVAMTGNDRKTGLPNEIPRALSIDEIAAVVQDFYTAAAYAKRAGSSSAQDSFDEVLIALLKALMVSNCMEQTATYQTNCRSFRSSLITLLTHHSFSLHSNINLRQDDYGGDHQKRCRFLLEVVQGMSDAIGSQRVGVRIAPFGLFNDVRLFSGCRHCMLSTPADARYGKSRTMDIPLSQVEWNEFSLHVSGITE